MKYDVAIVGGGIVGLAFACALARHTFSIVIIESAMPHAVEPLIPNHYSNRVSALNLASKHFLREIDVWSKLDHSRSCAYTHMEVKDGKHGGNIRFANDEIGAETLGYILENRALHTALMQKIATHPNITFLAPACLDNLSVTDHGAMLAVSNHPTLQAKLVVAADGAESSVRKLAGIEVEREAYQAHAIVATVQTSLASAHTAYQVFLETGPLAFLPLQTTTDIHLASIVWSLASEQAKALVNLDEAAFNHALSAASAHRFGAIIKTHERALFPLHKQQAKQYVAPRIALIGEAAHTIHPLAGQGLNMGLCDAAGLHHALMSAYLRGKDIASQRILRSFERQCKANNTVLALGIDRIHALFAANGQFWEHGRSVGLNVIHRSGPLKQFLMRYAIGERPFSFTGVITGHH